MSDGSGGQEATVKAIVISGRPDRVGPDLAPAPAPTAKASEVELAQFFSNIGAIEPPLDPMQLIRLYEKSSALRPNVEAYATNIDAFGYHLEPVINLKSSDADQIILDALTEVRQAKGDYLPPTPEDVKHARAVIERGMRQEKAELERFFTYAFVDKSFSKARMETREEEEIIGYAFWEVIRNGYREIVNFLHIPARTMRLRMIEADYHDVPTPQKFTAFDYELVDVKRRFRSYVQVVWGICVVYFKEFGDPRTMSARTGRYYSNREHLLKEEGPSAVEANEVLYWYVFSAAGPYGIPRWIGATLAVTGIRLSEVVNESYFKRKGVPPLALLVAGGKLAEGMAEKIKQYIREELEGVENFHSILVVEATGEAGASADARVRLEIKPLTGAQLQDALFQEYEKNSERKISRQFRLPDLIRGASQEVNRAQAEAALKFAEQQVFQPLREDFDEVMNRRIFADKRIRFWRFASNSAPAKDPELMTKLGTEWMKAGAMVPNEGRRVMGEVFNEEFPKVEAEWATKPMVMTLAGVVDPSEIQPAPAAAGAPKPGVPGMPADKSEDALAGALAVVHHAMAKSADEGHRRHMREVKDGVVTLAFPKAEIDSWFLPPGSEEDDGR